MQDSLLVYPFGYHSTDVVDEGEDDNNGDEDFGPPRLLVLGYDAGDAGKIVSKPSRIISSAQV
jgi:hypothetical protein